MINKIKAIYYLVKLLPELFKLAEVLKESNKKEKQIKSDIKRISHAFKVKDPNAINDIFS